MIVDDGRLTPTDQGEAQRGAGIGPTTPSGERPSIEQPPAVRRRPSVLVMVGGLAVVAVTVLVFALINRPSRSTAVEMPPAVDGPTAVHVGDARQGAPVIAPRPVTGEDLARLPQATTFGVTPGAPRDPAPAQMPVGRVAHPTVAVAAFAGPGDAPIAAVPAHQPIGIAPNQVLSDTWLPILQERPGWALVALPSRPNGSVGWLYIDDPAITVAATPSVITVDRARFELTLTTEGSEPRRWTIGVGKPGSATPGGRTFLLAAISDTNPTFSPIVLPLGSHSDTYENYGGGPGTVGVHTWPSADVYGKASSDGCVRVPPEALQVLAEVPLGTAVLIK
ncbi:ErfK/YbiS/YcfS/YnhG [Alloactinosynnema sp. L-07]|uniref:L,D-transpeptidase n=1 Tax=Alloactinosynnema sp. L-07 TaxID=1653480 RepID=UPI00065EF743|nr:L,D-transpeptidase [Alloactinosynnema sp. L-07]CRK57008.1 ErfK/YbiS/YcfS/YnhG [Alloactinosynnema sp. L-07]